MSTLNDRRREVVEIGFQEQSPSPSISKERPVRSQLDDHEGKKAVEQVVFAESGVEDVGGLRSHVITSSKEKKKLVLMDEKKDDCRPPPENIDECAEEFISRFRKQLQIQRLQSLENYEQMLTRGL